ncbi:hypothetical protein AADU72_004519 [Vibrio vulnificus]
MSVEVYYENLENIVKNELSQANDYVKIAVAWITFKNFESLFLELHNRGVSVEILVSDSQQLRTNQMPFINKLISAGIKITICKMPNSWNYMHHKFAVIDDMTVLNGSFNWSANAAKSFENLMVIRNEQEIVRKFTAEFGKILVLDQKAIDSLQSIKKCTCGGYIVNLLVFDGSPMPMTFEYWGDIVAHCNSCGYESKIYQGVQDTGFHSEFSGYEFVDDGSVTKLSIDRSIDEYYTGCSVHNYLIHGIGFVYTKYVYPDSEVIGTAIKWKNKFVEQYIDDEYPTDFGVYYH